MGAFLSPLSVSTIGASGLTSLVGRRIERIAPTLPVYGALG